MSDEARLREEIRATGALLRASGIAHGTAGNLSVRLDDGDILITPTNSRLGALDATALSRVSAAGEWLSGDKPSKEYICHLAVYRARPQAAAIVHLHSTHAVAVSCLDHSEHTDAIPPLTAYHVMKIGTLPVVPYHPPGDPELAWAIERNATEHACLLLANHGPLVSAPDLWQGVNTFEELEESAKIALLLQGRATSPLTDEQVAELTRRTTG